MAVARVFLERIGQAPSSYQDLCTFRGLLSDVCVRDEIEARGCDERTNAGTPLLKQVLVGISWSASPSQCPRGPFSIAQPVAVAVGGYGRWRHGHHGGLGGGGRIAFRMTPMALCVMTVDASRPGRQRAATGHGGVAAVGVARAA